MQSFLVFISLLMLSLALGTSTTITERCCMPHEEPYWIFPRRTNTDAVVLSNAVLYDLDVFSLCFFVRVDPEDDSGSTEITSFSYATTEHDNAINFVTSPSIRVLVNGVRLNTNLTINDGNWHQICFTWDNSEGHYQLYINGELQAEGDSFATGVVVKSGGTAVLGQDQDSVGNTFYAEQAFVGHLAEVNLWGTVLSESDIVAERSNCHITAGSVIKSQDFINLAEVRGGVQVVCG